MSQFAGRSHLEEETGALGANPDACIEEAHQSKSTLTIRKFFVAVMLANFLGMILLGLNPLGIPPPGKMLLSIAERNRWSC